VRRVEVEDGVYFNDQRYSCWILEGRAFYEFGDTKSDDVALNVECILPNVL
jgi:hypothetical protein